MVLETREVVESRPHEPSAASRQTALKVDTLPRHLLIRLQPLRGKIKNRLSPPVKAFWRERRRSMGRPEEGSFGARARCPKLDSGRTKREASKWSARSLTHAASSQIRHKIVGGWAGKPMPNLPGILRAVSHFPASMTCKRPSPTETKQEGSRDWQRAAYRLPGSCGRGSFETATREGQPRIRKTAPLATNSCALEAFLSRGHVAKSCGHSC